ncbi:site-specific DNA-methyltransferase [Lonepinella koalarum]|uniref:site-specific DNA-methyltransferase n=1 Tax=Lonepinella koalarum TaxID=53417 RepID=UPI003F6E1536
MQQPNNRQGSDRIGSDRQDFAFNLTRLQQLKSILPEIFCENEIDFDKFKALFSEQISTTPDRYMLNWAGKSEAYHTLQSPSFKTLTPCPQESVDFDHSDNIFIEGENLDVLKILQKSYFNSVKMIYIDPPYNTGNDFVYHDNFASRLDDYQQQSGEKDENGLLKKAFVRNSKENGHYHSNWLNMMLPRLHLAKNLLKDDGVIFISIDDNEQAQLKLLCDEVFGEENFVADFCISSNSSKNNSKLVSITHEYLLCYAKNKLDINKQWHSPKNNIKDFNKRVNQLIKNNLEHQQISSELSELVKYPRFFEFDHYTYIDKKGVFRASDLTAPSSKNFYPIIHPITKKECKSGTRGWGFSERNMNELIANEQILFGEDETTVPQLKNYLSDNIYSTPKSILFFDSQNSTKWVKENKLYFPFPKSIDFIKYIIETVTEENDLILDFFAGSATTAHAVMQLNAEDNGNCRFICVQMPELTDEKSEAFKAGFKNIAEISKERIRRAGKQIAENNPDNPLDTGFKVFKLSDSHFKQWQSPNVENLAQQLEFFIDPVADSAEPQAMLYEILLRLGLKLSVKVRLENDVFWLDDENGKRYAILLSKANEALFNQIIEQKPLKVVTLDRLFNGNDALKKNTELQFADHNIQFLVI